MVGIEPTFSCSQGTRVAATLHPVNLLSSSDPYGNRTHLSALKGQCPSPIDERAKFLSCAHTVSAKWAGRRSNPRYLIFSQALYRLSYQPIDPEL